MSEDGFDPFEGDARHLTLQQWTALRKSIVARHTNDMGNPPYGCGHLRSDLENLATHSHPPGGACRSGLDD